MKLYKIETPLPCDIEDCDNKNAVLIVRTDEGVDYAVCPECVAAMSRMNNENEEFFAQTPLPGYVGEKDDFYDLPYTRADEMADQANADYYDEVARRRTS